MSRRLFGPDAASGTALAATAAAYGYHARALPAGTGWFPLALALGLGALGLAILVRGARERESRQPSVRPAALIALTAVYAWAWTKLGFLGPTLAFASAVAWWFGARGWRLLVVPALVTAVVYAVFAVGLGVALP